jgi:hypothetical protein
MISGKTKEDLIKEIAKFGNVYLSCLKIGVNASTYYRWKDKDATFKEEAEEAEKDGRKNICHVAEHALLKNIKDGQQRAIEYALNHNSEVYRKKETSNVVIVHKKELAEPAKTVISSTDPYTYIDSDTEFIRQMSASVQEGLLNRGEIPNKPDGTPIELDELLAYTGYITDWQDMQERMGLKKVAVKIDDSEEYFFED